MTKTAINTPIDSLLAPLIEQLIEAEVRKRLRGTSDIAEEKNEKIPELITIGQCTRLVPALSYYTVRQLVERGEIKAIRTGKGKGGKFLIYKDSLIEYIANEDRI
ncbi:MAG: hypothetical protein IKK32_00650 [Oscillospiraceae bacterium]|nr:hypothetical protein [Oscillospiraceae bacterium]